MSAHPGLFCRCLIVLILCGLTSIENPSLLQAQSILLPAPELITARQGLPQAFVPAIVQDNQGFIWMATRDGLCRYDGHSFLVFQPTPDGRPSLTSSGIAGLTITPQGRLWISSEQGDLDLFNPFLETFVNFSQQPFYKRQFGTDLIDNYYPDRNNRLWLVLRRQGLVCIDLRTYRVRRFGVHPYQRQSVGGPDGGAIQQDQWGTVWVVTEKGLMQFDAHTEQLRAYDLPDQDIRELYTQPNGQLLVRTPRFLLVIHPKRGVMGRYPLPNHHQQWVSHFTTDSQGTTYFNLDNLVLRFNQQGIQTVAHMPDARYIRSLFIDRSDVLWMGTNGEGVRKYNLKAVAFEARPYQLNFHSDLLSAYFGVPPARGPHFPAGSSAYNFRYTFDQQGKLWFNAGSTPFYQLDLATKKLTSIPFPAQLVLDNLAQSASLATDPDGRVWAMYDSLVVYYQKGQWKRFPFPLQGRVSLPALQLVVDRQALWLATQSNGLYRVDRQSGQIRHYVPQPGNASSLSSRELIGLFADPLDANLLWIGTFGSGLCRFDKRTGLCRRLTTQNGLPNNVVYSAIPDRQGFVWVATNQGLCQVDRRTFRTRTYTQEDGLQADEFNRFHVMHQPGRRAAGMLPGRRSDHADRIILGGITGMTVFDPAQIRDDTYQPVIQLTAIQVNNRPLPPLRDSLPVQAMQALDLAYDQNFVTVAFASMQYNRQTKIRYRYWLEGVDQAWIQTDRPVAGYTALAPGRYTLRLNASNTSGHWSPHVRTLTIVIRAPWWATGWAYTLYGLLTVGLLWAYIRFRTQQIRGRQERMTQDREASQLRQLDELKTRFFANVTHELRTPLTLILGPAQHLKTRIQDQEDQHWLAMIDRQAHQLLSLTNQLLDLSRLEAGVVRVAEQPDDLAAFVAQVVESMRPEAVRKGLALTLTSELPMSVYWFDGGKLERIALNLLTNAIKFTRQGGIQVWLREGVELVVEDSGPGLTMPEQERVFDRFYQATPNSASSPGSGIGLALVSELVTLQQGTVRVVSPWTTAHSGTRFVVQLPYRPVSADESAPPPPIDPPAAEPHPDEPTIGESADERPLVLVVEDNSDLRAFISQAVATFCRVEQANDGQTGWEKALALGPDLIISDVLMPRMDGFTLCRTLKEDSRTSHMPVLLLTAKTTFDDRMQGLAGGADAYLTKPFHPGELQLQVGNLLTRQQRQRTWLQQQLLRPEVHLPEPLAATDDEPPVAVPVSADRSFMATLQLVLAQHLNNPKFGVEELAQAMQLSRGHLYRKVKTISGLTVTELLRNYRLGQARQLLNQHRPVADVAEAVGFDSAGYFARCFREQYGLSPTAYQQQDNHNSQQ